MVDGAVINNDKADSRIVGFGFSRKSPIRLLSRTNVSFGRVPGKSSCLYASRTE